MQPLTRPDPVPLFPDRVVEAIATGALREGSPLPSTRALAAASASTSTPSARRTTCFASSGSTTLLAEATARGMTRDDVLGICRTVLATFGEGMEES